MTELALTRIFSVTMYYHFAFLAISIALFGLSASGVLVYVLRHRLARRQTRDLLAAGALLHSVATLTALAYLVRIRVGLDYSPQNLFLMIAIYVLASLPFLTGGAVISLAFARLADRINVLYASDLIGAAVGCLLLIPLLNRLGAPGVVMTAATLSMAAALCFASAGDTMARLFRGAHHSGDSHGRPAHRRRALCRRRHERVIWATVCCSASGIRSRASRCTTVRTVTGP